MWKKDLALDLAVSSIQVAPTDCRRLCLCGEKGSLVVMRLLDLTRDRCEDSLHACNLDGIVSEMASVKC